MTSSRKRKQKMLDNHQLARKSALRSTTDWSAVEEEIDDDMCELDRKVLEVKNKIGASVNNVCLMMIAMLRHWEPDDIPRVREDTINELIQRFFAGDLTIHQRGFSINSGVMNRFNRQVVNTSSIIDTIHIKEGTRVIDGEHVPHCYVTRGAQRLSQWILVYLGLIPVDYIPGNHKVPTKRQRENHMEKSPMDLIENYKPLFFQKTSKLRTDDLHYIVFTAMDERGNTLSNPPNNHASWGLDLSDEGVIVSDTAPDSVKEFFEGLKKYLVGGYIRYHLQTSKSGMMTSKMKTNFLSTRVPVQVVKWETTADLYSIVQECSRSTQTPGDILIQMQDKMSKFIKHGGILKKLVDFTSKYGFDNEMNAAYDSLVRAIMITQGCEYVAPACISATHPIMIEYLVANYMLTEPEDDVKKRIRGAVHFLSLYEPSDRCVLTSDDLVLMLAYAYHATDVEHLPDEDDGLEVYPLACVSETDRDHLKRLFPIIKARGHKTRVKKIKAGWDVTSSWAEEVSLAWQDHISLDGTRNVVPLVSHILRKFQLEAYPVDDDDDESMAGSDEEEEDDADTDVEASTPIAEEAGEADGGTEAPTPIAEEAGEADGGTEAPTPIAEEAGEADGGTEAPTPIAEEAGEADGGTEAPTPIAEEAGEADGGTEAPTPIAEEAGEAPTPIAEEAGEADGGTDAPTPIAEEAWGADDGAQAPTPIAEEAGEADDGAEAPSPQDDPFTRKEALHIFSDDEDFSEIPEGVIPCPLDVV